MHESPVAFLVIAILELLLLASLAAVLLRRLQFPYTIGLMIIGILLAFTQERLDVLEAVRRIRLTPDIVLYLFLPTLVFPAAVQLDLRLLRQNAYPLVLLAFPGVIVSTAIVGSVVAALTPLSWSAALLFGALISATDPVAVVALFKDLRVPERLSVLVDGESLFNDATAIVLFLVIFSAGASGGVGPLTVVRGAVEFLWVSVGGLGVGALTAVLYGRVVRLAEDDPLVEIALSTVPFDFAERQRILDLTAGVVLFTLLVQGTTVRRLIRCLDPTAGGEQMSQP